MNKRDTKMIINNSLNFMKHIILGLLLCGLLAFASPMVASAEDASEVSITHIDYEELEMKIALNGNKKVFYSDAKETTWNEIEGLSSNGFISLDISWVKDTADYTMTLKGSEDDTIITVILPANNRSLSVKFDKLDGHLVIANEDGAFEFEWRKSTSYIWNDAIDISQSGRGAAAFLDELEALRSSGSKIYVRIPQIKGTSESDVGSRPSKEVLVTLTKRTNAPKLTINTTKMTLNTTEAMEYKVYSIGGVVSSSVWTSATKAMTLTELMPSSLMNSNYAISKEVVMMFRTEETDTKPYSKTYYLTIPVQRSAPLEVIEAYTSSKYSLTFTDANKSNPVEYTIVKPESTFNASTAAWKGVTTNKAVSFTKKAVPEGSKIYVRYKTILESSSATLKVPSTITSFSPTYTK